MRVSQRKRLRIKIMNNKYYRQHRRFTNYINGGFNEKGTVI